MPLDGAFCGSRTFGGADDLGHLGCRPPGDLALERLGHVQQSLLGDRLAGAGDRRERLEATGAIGPDPAVDGPPCNSNPVPIGSDMVPAGQLAHQRASLADGQRLISSLPDERIAEQRDVSLRLIHGVEPPRN